MPLHDWTKVEAGIFHDFHTVWIGEIRNTLNEGLLPSGYYALAEQHAGHFISDVLTLHAPPSADIVSREVRQSGDGGLAVAEVPPQVAIRESHDLAARQLRRSLTIRHVSTHRIIALLEIVSPANKDRVEHVEEFAMKTVTALERGIHVLVVDLFPPSLSAPKGLDFEIRRRFLGDVTPPSELNGRASLVSYAIGRLLDIYRESVALADLLPAMPLFLTDQRYVNVPLEETYQVAWPACQSSGKQFWTSLPVRHSKRGMNLRRSAPRASGQVHRQTIVAQVDPGRQLCVHHRMINAAGTMSKVSLAGADPPSRSDGLVEIHMRWMRLGPQGTQHQSVQSSEQVPTGFGNCLGVGAIGNVTHSKSKDFETRAMIQRDRRHTCPQNRKRLAVDRMKLQRRHGAQMSLRLVAKSVIKRHPQTLLDLSRAIQRNGVPEIELK